MSLSYSFNMPSIYRPTLTADLFAVCNCSAVHLRQFRYIRIQPKTIDLISRLWGITTEFVGFIPHNFVLRSIVLG